MNLYRDYGYNITNELRGVDCSICEHDKQKRYCKDCGGSDICEHGKQKRYCKDCGDSCICEHEKQRYICKIVGSGICEHDKRKAECKECSPVTCSICNKLYSKNSIKRHINTH